MSSRALAPEELRRRADPDALGFATTEEIAPADGLIGQERALEALKFGVGMDAYGYNIYAPGTQGSGRHKAVRRFLEARAVEAPTPDDWVYVYNFEEAHRPHAINLPAGRGCAFADACDRLIEQLKSGLRSVFESEDYRLRRQAIDDAFRGVQQSIFETMSAKARTQGLQLVPQKNGMAIAPLGPSGEPMAPEAIQALNDVDRKALQEKSKAILDEFSAASRALPQHDRERRQKLEALNSETAQIAVDRAFDDQFADFKDWAPLAAHLDAVHKDLLQRPELFLRDQEDDGAPLDQTFNRYRANVLIRQSPNRGAPVVYVDNPDVGQLIGRIEHVAHMGAMLTDFTLIKPGALHRANGGFLLVDAERLLTEPMAWRALKRRVRGCDITFEAPVAGASTATAVTLEPEPIPLKVKVVLFGSREILGLLAANDPDFEELFKVAADFDETFGRTPDCERAYCGLLAGIAAAESDRPISHCGCAALIDRAARIAGDRERLTLRIRLMADLIREAAYWAREEGAPTINAGHVTKAVDEQVRRVDLVRDKIHEQVTRDTVLIETSGARVGQINGLAVLQAGGFAFGKPSRITARVRMGAGRVVDIEREVAMGGALHSKGVLILSSYLAARYALDAPMALRASLVFEQSYGGVDGDSASSTELYALLSALSGFPIKQSLAVTGSVSQNGEVQAIGGVNEKIEGFYDICVADGLTGDQGALIPASNVKNLMLRDDVAEACAAGRFHVYAVSSIDEGIEILTGVEAGARGADGRFPDGTVNAAVEAKLLAFAEARRRFAESALLDGDGAV
ncbi:MAG: AAA family ATPase [Pseudomonadota bacterium]